VIPHQNLRWLGFFAASLLAHAALLTWVEFSSGGASGASSAIRVLLASAGSDAGEKRAAPRRWRPASATRDRDLFARAAAPSPGPAPATAADAGLKVKEIAPAAKDAVFEAPPRRKAAAEKTVAHARAESPRDPKPRVAPVTPAGAAQSATGSAAAAAAPSNGETMASAGVGRDSPVMTAAAPAGSAASETMSAGAPEENNGTLLALLHQAIDRGKRYPALARRQRREGTTTVRFRLSPNGEMDAIDIDRSSGFRVLDSAAISAVSSVAPFAPARTLLTEMTRFKVDVTFRLN
jgi:protein TonB